MLAFYDDAVVVAVVVAVGVVAVGGGVSFFVYLVDLERAYFVSRPTDECVRVARLRRRTARYTQKKLPCWNAWFSQTVDGYVL